MKASTVLAFIALLTSYLSVAASPLIEVRDNSVINNIQIEIEKTINMTAGRTDMGLAGSHRWGDDVRG
jgi:hypothetical protein